MVSEEQHNVIVVIPIYQKRLTDLERRTILHNIDTLQKYAIRVIVPESLSVQHVICLPENVQVLDFRDECFATLEGYNKLMRSDDFYSRFSDFEYLLIAQHDSFIFQDDLLRFYSKGYDYWGAPWIDYELINYKFLRPVLPFLHKSRYLKPLRGLLGKKYLVGNGGLSLRKVSTHLKVTQEFRAVIKNFESGYDTWIGGGARSMMEDIFWTLYVPRVYAAYTIAPWQEAVSFSFEMNPQKAFQLNRQQLPFGCHAFDKVDPEFYKKFIEFLN